MADKAVSELIEASEIAGSDLFVLEQAGTAKKLSGQTLTAFLLKLVEAHGGITGIEKTNTEGLVDTYTISMVDLSTTTFTVTNGEKGDKGDNTYTWVKYSSSMPTKNSDIYDNPDNYIGIYTGSSSTAPINYTDYKWFAIKGEKGETGAAASITSQSVEYATSASGTTPPSSGWAYTIPTVAQGQYLWTRSTVQFNTGGSQVSYSVGRFGLDGSGAVSKVANKEPDGTGNVPLTAADVGAIPDEDGAVSKSFTVTLPSGGWSDNTQSVTATGVTAANTVIVSPAPASYLTYAEAQVRCTAQASNSLTFTCEDVPSAELTVNVTVINK